MGSNVTEFPKKIDPNNAHEFIEAYAKALGKLDNADRPTNILILEMYKERDGEVGLDHYVAGPPMHISEIVGNVEAWKMYTLLARGGDED